MGIFLAAIILVIAAVLLIGAVVFGFLRNRNAPGIATSAAEADLTPRRR